MNDTKEEAETIVLSPEALKVAEEIGRLTGLQSIEDAIRLSLGDELYFRKKIRDGYKVLVSRDGDYWEVDLKITD